MLIRIQLMEISTMNWGGWDKGIVSTAPYYIKALGRYKDIDGMFSLKDCIKEGKKFLKDVQDSGGGCTAFELYRLEFQGALVYKSYEPIKIKCN